MSLSLSSISSNALLPRISAMPPRLHFPNEAAEALNKLQRCSIIRSLFLTSGCASLMAVASVFSPIPFTGIAIGVLGASVFLYDAYQLERIKNIVELLIANPSLYTSYTTRMEIEPDMYKCLTHLLTGSPPSRADCYTKVEVEEAQVDLNAVNAVIKAQTDCLLTISYELIFKQI